MKSFFFIQRGLQVRFKSDFYVTPGVRLRSKVRRQPLTGIKVALLSRSSVGDFAGRILEDFGAEVTAFHEYAGKFGIQKPKGRRIDLNRTEDVNLIKNVSKKTDILLDCLDGGRLEETGLDPDQILKTNSKLILARITGYGQTGIYGTKTGANTTFAALSGAMTGLEPVDEKNLEIVAREARALALAGRNNCLVGVILALYDREHTGKGQIIDMSLTESIAYVDHVARLTELQIPKIFHRFYCTLDKKLLAVGILNSEDQQKFLKLIGVTSTENLEAIVTEKISQKNLSDWIWILKDVGFVSEVLNYSNVGIHKQHRKRTSFDLDETSNKWIPKPSPKFSSDF